MSFDAASFLFWLLPRSKKAKNGATAKLTPDPSEVVRLKKGEKVKEVQRRGRGSRSLIGDYKNVKKQWILNEE